jgi:hypothetical protein
VGGSGLSRAAPKLEDDAAKLRPVLLCQPLAACWDCRVHGSCAARMKFPQTPPPPAPPRQLTIPNELRMTAVLILCMTGC